MLVAVDLDGTALAADGQLHPVTAAALRRVHESGRATLMLATGRSVNEAAPHVRTLGVDALPAVLYNGAVCVRFGADGSVQEVLDRIWLTAEVAAQARALAAEAGALLSFYTETEMCVHVTCEAHEALTRRYEELTGDSFRRVDSYDEFDGAGAPKLLLMTDDPDALMERARAALAPAVAHLVRGDFFVEVLRPGVCKGTTAAALADRLGAPLADGVAFGDSDNDIEMLQLARDGVAMGNAREVLKAAATRVSQWTNDEGGVGEELGVLGF